MIVFLLINNPTKPLTDFNNLSGIWSLLSYLSAVQARRRCKVY